MGANVDAAAIVLADAVDVALGGNGGPFEFLRWKRGNGETSNWSRRRERRELLLLSRTQEEVRRKTLVVIWTARRETLSQHVHDETIRENDAV